MNVVSLFAGIGGLDRGLEAAGMAVVGQVEIDAFCRRVLERHWPGVPRHDDVKTASDWWRSGPWAHEYAVDLVCGGFPCQDISNAHTNGSRDSLAGAKSGLWSAYRDFVAAVTPRWVLVENVAAWERWVPDVRADLAALGYASVPVELSAGAVGAPHRRPRVFVVANADSEGEPLRTFHAEMARLSPVPRADGDWREPFTGPVRVADGLSPRVDRLRTLGNAVVPQVAELLGRWIAYADMESHKEMA